MAATAVTGVSGHIGGRVAQGLLDEGRSVLALGRSPAPPANLSNHPGFHYVQATQAPEMEAIMRAHDVECSVHCAGLFIAQHAPGDIAPLIDANITFGASVAEASAQAGASFINLGSYWQHADGARGRSNTLYAATKNAFEVILDYYTDRHGMPVQTVVIYDVYDETDPRNKIMGHLVRAALDGTPLELSSGTQLINLTHCDDLIAALRIAHDRAANPDQRIAAVRAESFLTIRELAREVETTTGRPLDARWGAREDRPREMHEPWIAYPVLSGWTPRVDLPTGIRRLSTAISKEVNRA